MYKRQDEGVSWEYDEDGVPQFTSLVKDDPDTDPMTKYNGATWGSCCIQATNPVSYTHLGSG